MFNKFDLSCTPLSPRINITGRRWREKSYSLGLLRRPSEIKPPRFFFRKKRRPNNREWYKKKRKRKNEFRVVLRVVRSVGVSISRTKGVARIRYINYSRNYLRIFRRARFRFSRRAGGELIIIRPRRRTVSLNVFRHLYSFTTHAGRRANCRPLGTEIIMKQKPNSPIVVAGR